MGLEVYYNTNDDSYYGGNSTYIAGQTFTPSETFTLTSIKALLYKIGTPGTCTVAIYATSAGVPTGAPLVSNTFDGNTLTSDSAGEWKEVTLTPTELTGSTMYALVIMASGNFLGWRRDQTSPTYTGGTEVTSSNGGSSWSADNSHDLMFETYSSAGGGGIAGVLSSTYYQNFMAGL
jgi:hypothetical protein